jgi:hypothetical protein
VLELTDLGAQTYLKVMESRDGGWATAFALELARKGKTGRKRSS